MTRKSEVSASSPPTGVNPLPSIARRQFGLQIGADFTQFIQEKRAFVSLLEQAALIRIGSGKGPFFVAEKLAFQEGFRKRRRR